MRVAERATPVAAVIAALSTLACCLPFGFLGAMGLASLSVWAQSFRNWFIGGAAILLVVGFAQLYRGRNQCKKRSPVSIALFWVAVAIVFLIVLFPPSNRQPSSGVSQVKMKYAAWFALVVVALSVGWYLWGSRRAPRGQPPITSLTSTNLDQFKSAFNGAADRDRLVLLLSPT